MLVHRLGLGLSWLIVHCHLTYSTLPCWSACSSSVRGRMGCTIPPRDRSSLLRLPSHIGLVEQLPTIKAILIDWV